MIRISNTTPRAVRSVPVVLYLVGGFLLLSLLPLLWRAPSRQALVAVLLLAGLGGIFVLLALLHTRRLSVTGEQLVLKTPFRRTELHVAGATLLYDRDNNLSQPSYWLKLQTEAGTVPLLRMGYGMALLQEMKRARRIADALGLPMQVDPGLKEAARQQGKAFIQARHIPWAIGIAVLVMSVVGFVISRFVGDTPRPGRIRIICPNVPVEVNGIRYQKPTTIHAGVKPGRQRVRVRMGGLWTTWHLDVPSGATKLFRCLDPPPGGVVEE